MDIFLCLIINLEYIFRIRFVESKGVFSFSYFGLFSNSSGALWFSEIRLIQSEQLKIGGINFTV